MLLKPKLDTKGIQNWAVTERLILLFASRVNHPGMEQGILSKTGMGYRGTSADLLRAQRCTTGVSAE